MNEIEFMKYEGWEFLGIVKGDDGSCKRYGSAKIWQLLEIETFGSDAVIMATGGPGIIFGKTTNSMINTGSATSILYQTRRSC